jgi:bacillithiol synthase
VTRASSAQTAADSRGGPALVPGIEILTEPLQGGGQLVRDYIDGAAGLEPFFTGHPGSIQAYRRKAAEVDSRLDADARMRLANGIVPLGDAAERLRSILAGNGYFVTTGQQPALFGGPLYTLYKVLSAIRLADVLEAQLGRPVLALFWIGADDHDWDEANHAALLDADGYVQRITVRGAADAPPLPLSERVWGSDIDRAVREFCALLPVSEFSHGILAHVREVYTAGMTVSASFTATMELLLRDRRVALVNPAHAAVRRAAAPVLAHEAAHAAAHHEVLRRQTARLAEAGYPAQVPIADGASNIMLLDDQGRDRLMHGADGWHTRRQRQRLGADEVLARIAGEPDAFSPNVLLRPVVESALFPTLAYVAGPGELSYFAQIGCLFAAHGILPPVVVPRPSVTLVEARIRRLLDRNALDPATVRRPFHELVTDVVRREIPPAATEALERIRTTLHDVYGEVMDATDAIDPTLRGPLTSARNWSTVRAHEAEKRILRHLKRRNGIRVEQLRKAAASLYPGGAPQERTLNAMTFAARYGPGLVAAIETAIDAELKPVAEWTGPDCD